MPFILTLTFSTGTLSVKGCVFCKTADAGVKEKAPADAEKTVKEAVTERKRAETVPKRVPNLCFCMSVRSFMYVSFPENQLIRPKACRRFPYTDIIQESLGFVQTFRETFSTFLLCNRLPHKGASQNFVLRHETDLYRKTQSAIRPENSGKKTQKRFDINGRL